MKTIKLKAPAKINLTLEVLRKLPSGFHKIRTVMTRIPSLYDEISVTFYPDKNGIFIKSSDKGIPLDEKNICFKAANKFFEEIGKSVGLKINIKKNIPVGAGLGGGSSDGAAVLKILSEYFSHPLSEEKIIKIASEVGKDIPFFFPSKNSALIEGAGEIIGENFSLPRINFLLVNPKIHISTKDAYKSLSPVISKIKNRKNISKEMVAVIKSKKIDLISKYIYNDFDIIMKKKYPLIEEIKNKLVDLGASGALMTGSGSTVFGIFGSRKVALKAKKILKKHYLSFFVELG